MERKGKKKRSCTSQVVVVVVVVCSGANRYLHVLTFTVGGARWADGTNVKECADPAATCLSARCPFIARSGQFDASLVFLYVRHVRVLRLAELFEQMNFLIRNSRPQMERNRWDVES
jgi:hypothetical protein